MNNCKLPKEAFDFLFQNSSLVYRHDEGGKQYMFLPFWFEIVDKENCVVNMHLLGGNVPAELKEALVEQREVAIRRESKDA